MKKVVKKLLIIIFFIVTLIKPVSGKELNNNLIDFTKTGSIEVSLIENETNSPIKDVEISLYQVAYITKENSNSLIYTEDFKDCKAKLDDLTDTDLISEIDNCRVDKTTSLKSITSEEGKVSFNDLTFGLYLVTQTNEVSGYTKIEPFLVIMPTLDNNNYIYDIKASPKVEIYKTIDITVVKEYNTTKKTLPEVTIGLYKKDTLLEKVVLNDSNNWTYTWHNLIKSDEYNVKELNIPEGFTPTYKKDNYLFTVTNTDSLARTGQIFYPIVILAASGMILISMGIIKQK